MAATVFPCALAQQYIQPVSVIPGQAFQLGGVTYVPATSQQTVIPVQQVVPAQPTPGQRPQKSLPIAPVTTATPATVVPATVPSRPHSRYEAPTTPAPRPVTALTSTPPTPTIAPSPMITPVNQVNKPNFSIEITGSYNFATRRIYSGVLGNGPKINTSGIDLTFLYHINSKNAITFRVGYSFGLENETYVDFDHNVYNIDFGHNLYNVDFEISNLYFMPGYRGEIAISDSASLFWGVNLGIVSQHVKFTKTCYAYSTGSNSLSISGSEVGFAYSVEVGTQIRLSSNVGIVIAAGLSGSTAEPSKNEDEINQQILNPGLRLGVAISF